MPGIRRTAVCALSTALLALPLTRCSVETGHAGSGYTGPPTGTLTVSDVRFAVELAANRVLDFVARTYPGPGTYVAIPGATLATVGWWLSNRRNRRSGRRRSATVASP